MDLYNLLGDEQSRRIYQSRKNYSLTGDESFLQEMVDFTVRNRREWIEFRKDLEKKSVQGPLLIFGAGIWGKILWEETHDVVNWKACIDTSPQGKHFPIPIISFEEFIKEYQMEFVAVSSYKHLVSMHRQLLRAGIPENRIIRAGDVIHLLTEGGAYFDLEKLLPVGEKEVFVDGGCFDGFTTKTFFRWTKGKGYAYCFEMDKNNIASVRKNLCGFENYQIIPKALWSEKKTLSLLGSGDFSSSVSEEIGVGGNVCVEADTIDHLLPDQKVTYIKLDVEGAELEVLKGAKRMIQQQSPRLAVSIYHKKEDLWAIPSLIHAYNPGYRFYLRHYSFSWYDTVLYALTEG